MALFIKGTDTPIKGTKEILTGITPASGLDDEGVVIWSGGTTIDWDSQETAVTPEDGRLIWIGEDDEEYHGVDVEDRRADGTVVQFTPLEPDLAEPRVIFTLATLIEEGGELDCHIAESRDQALEILRERLSEVSDALKNEEGFVPLKEDATEKEIAVWTAGIFVWKITEHRL